MACQEEEQLERDHFVDQQQYGTAAFNIKNILADPEIVLTPVSCPDVEDFEDPIQLAHQSVSGNGMLAVRTSSEFEIITEQNRPATRVLQRNNN